MVNLSELKKIRKPIQNVNIRHRESLTLLERFAAWITKNVGTMGFFSIIFLWTAGWLLWNVFGPRELQFDPFPAFVFWLFISNMIQLFLLPLIMVGQNLEKRREEIRAESEYEINLKSEREIEAIIEMLEEQKNEIRKISSKLGADD